MGSALFSRDLVAEKNKLQEEEQAQQALRAQPVTPHPPFMEPPPALIARHMVAEEAKRWSSGVELMEQIHSMVFDATFHSMMLITMSDDASKLLMQDQEVEVLQTVSAALGLHPYIAHTRINEYLR